MPFSEGKRCNVNYTRRTSATASLIAVLPSSILSVALSNPDAAASAIEQAFSTGTPVWFLSLPPEVQTYFETQVIAVQATATASISPVSTSVSRPTTTSVAASTTLTSTRSVASPSSSTVSATPTLRPGSSAISGQSSASSRSSTSSGTRTSLTTLPINSSPTTSYTQTYGPTDANIGSASTGGLSTGAKAGIGVGVSLGIIGALALVGVCLYVGRKNRPPPPPADSQRPYYEPQVGPPIAELPESSPQNQPTGFFASVRNKFANEAEAKAPVAMAAPVLPYEKQATTPTPTATSPEAFAPLLELGSNPPLPAGNFSELPATQRYAALAPNASYPAAEAQQANFRIQNAPYMPATQPVDSTFNISQISPSQDIVVPLNIPPAPQSQSSETSAVAPATVPPTSEPPASIHSSDTPEGVLGDDPEVARLRADRAKLQERKLRLLQLQQLDEEDEKLKRELESRLSKVGGELS
jgi:hypothetical protein